MSGLLREISRKVDDFDGVVGALLDADAAADAQHLGDFRDRRCRLHDDALLAWTIILIF